MDGGDSPRAKRTRYNQALDFQAAYGHQYCGLCSSGSSGPSTEEDEEHVAEPADLANLLHDRASAI